MRKHGLVLIALIALGLILIPSAAPARAQSPVTLVSTTTLKIRSGPGTGYPQIGSLPAGVSVRALGRDAPAYWAYVDYQGTRGWVAAWLATVTGDMNALPVTQPDGSGALPAAPSAPLGPPGGGAVTAIPTVALRMRSGPGTDYPLVTTIPAGVSVPVLDYDAAADWIKVDYNGQQGWSAAWLATINGQLSWLSAPPAPAGVIATVLGVVDGNTIEVAIGGSTDRVRYLGLNAPQMDEACGPESASYNASLVSGQQVTLIADQTDRDQYGRLLRYVYVGDRFVNAEMVNAGYALAVPMPPDVTQAGLLAQLEYDARHAGRGCWASAPLPAVELEPGAACDCSANVYNCGDFATHADAQTCFEYCVAAVGYDVHRLDSDNNNLACELLP